MDTISLAFGGVIFYSCNLGPRAGDAQHRLHSRTVTGYRPKRTMLDAEIIQAGSQLVFSVAAEEQHLFKLFSLASSTTQELFRTKLFL